MEYHPKLARLRQVVQEYGNEAALFDYLERCGFGKSILRFLHDVNALVTEAFAAVPPRDSGDPYVRHLHGVCAIGAVYCKNTDPEQLAAALLHDIHEQFPREWPEERIAAQSTPRTAYLVMGCSIDRNLYYYHDDNDRKRTYYDRIASSMEFVPLKLWDRTDNQLTLSFCTLEKQTRKNEETRHLILPIAKQYNILKEELRATVEENAERIARLQLVATP
ncbi:MAG: HD domain-containing protein [Candidatus Moraniibacteriota bacterium]